MILQYEPLDSDWVKAIRTGAPDANGQVAERVVSDGSGNPCRHCLNDIPEHAGMLVLAARPFPDVQPYAETGPIFLCAEACAPYAGDGPPPILRSRPQYLLKGYGADNRIVYGTGAIVPVAEVQEWCETLLEDTRIAYIHVRSARNNCFQLAVRRKEDGDGKPARPDPRNRP